MIDITLTILQSMLWPLMAWQCKEPGHQQVSYWTSFTDIPASEGAGIWNHSSWKISSCLSYEQYHSCWCLPGDTMSQFVSRNGIDIVSLSIPATAQDELMAVTCYRLALNGMLQWGVDSLWSSDAIWHHRFGAMLDEEMACCLMALSHYLNQYWLTIHWCPRKKLNEIWIKMWFSLKDMC